MKYSEWKTYKLNQVGEVVSGGTPSTKIPQYWYGEIPWITPKDLSGYNKKVIYSGDRSISKEGLEKSSVRLIPKNSILFSSRAPIGYVAKAGVELGTNQGFKNLVVNKNHCHDFIYYLLINETENIKRISGGSTFSEISGTAFGNFKVKVPEKKIQKIIAKILSSLDDKIELNNKINSNLEELAQTLYKHWFVDFEFPNEEGLPYKSSGGKMVESELGLIPEGWNVKTISDITTFNKRGYAPSYTENDEPTGIPVINQRCVRNHTIIEEAVRYHDNNIKTAPDDRYHNKWDVLVNSMGVGTLGRVAVSSIQHNKIVHSVITILRPKTNKILNGIFAYAMLSFEDVFTSMGTGSTGQTSLSNKYLGETKIVLAPLLIQKKLNETLENIQIKIDKNHLENNKLINLRDLLLPKLMSGEIRVPIKE